MRIKILAIVYILILAGIIILADLNGTNYFAFIRRVPYGDKIGHFFLMGMLSFVVNLALRARRLKTWKLNFLLGSLIVGIAVAVEEFSQMFVSGRTFDWSDLAADFAGILIFGEIARFTLRKFQSA